jgi:hypothetical protein
MLGMPGVDHEYDIFDTRAEITRIFAWLPCRCWITGKLLWFTHVIQGEAIWVGPGTPIVEFRHYNEAEYLMYKLTQ